MLLTHKFNFFFLLTKLVFSMIDFDRSVDNLGIFLEGGGLILMEEI